MCSGYVPIVYNYKGNISVFKQMTSQRGPKSKAWRPCWNSHSVYPMYYKVNGKYQLQCVRYHSQYYVIYSMPTQLQQASPLTKIYYMWTECGNKEIGVKKIKSVTRKLGSGSVPGNCWLSQPVAGEHWCQTSDRHTIAGIVADDCQHQIPDFRSPFIAIQIISTVVVWNLDSIWHDKTL